MFSTIRKAAAIATVAGAMVLATVAPATAVTNLSTDLSGATEVPGPGDPNGSGHVELEIRPYRGKVCFDLSWDKVWRPFAAHIHEGAPDAAGPIKVELFMTTEPLPGTITHVAGCVRNVPKDLLLKIVNHPADYYVNVHNVRFPAGAIRGQLG